MSEMNTSVEMQMQQQAEISQQPPMPQHMQMVQEDAPTLYDTHVKENFHLFGVASILYACLYTFCMYKNDAGITYPLLVVGSIVFINYCLKKLEMKLKKESIFYVISMILLSVSTFCTDDSRIIVFNKIGVFLLTISMLLGVLYNTKQWNLGKYLGSIVKICFMAIGEMGRPFSDGIWYCKNKLDKKNRKYLYLLIGFGITIPLFIVIFLLLLSADAVFRDVSTQVLRNIQVGDGFAIASMIAFIFIATYCIMTYMCKKRIKEEVEDSRKWEPLIAIPVATVLSLLYIVFSVIQIVYLFMGNMQLPEGYTYAAYAREGFFQLLAVSMINLVMVLIGLYYFKKSKVLKAILTIMSLCTFIMIASSALRMIIYIQYYYLTFLRILVLWSLAVLFLIFVGVIIYIVKENFPLFRYSMIIVTSFYIALSFSHPDYWIAKVNLASTEETRSEFFKGEPYRDYMLLEDLSADAAPVMVEWMKNEGLTFEKYNEEGISFDDFRDSVGENGTTYDKEWCAFSYQKQLKENCKDIRIRNFNVSRYLANNKMK